MVSEKHGEESSKYEVLDYTFRFLADFNEEPELNPVLAGYFSKLIACLLKHKKFELQKYIFQSKHLKSLIDHLYDTSIADLLVKLLSSSIIAEIDQEEIQQQVSHDLDKRKAEGIDLIID